MAFVDISNSYKKFQGSGFNFEANRKLREEQAQRLEEQRALRQQQIESEFPTEKPPEIKKSFQEKILQFTGGNVLARGLGLGLAQTGTKEVTDSLQKGEGEMQQRLIQAIRRNRAAGQDTSRLEASLKALTGTQTDFTDLYTEGITKKQVIGDSLQLATTAATAYAAPSAAKSVVTQPSIAKGIVQGAKTGAKAGAGFGASTGASQSLKNNKSLGEVAIDTVKGAAEGVVSGAVLGGAVGGISSVAKKLAEVRRATQTASKTQKQSGFVEDLVSPKLTTKVKEQALAEGRVTNPGILKPSRVLASKRDKAVAEAVKNVVSPKLTPADNLIRIDRKVKEINRGVKEYAKANKVPFNSNQLKKQLNSGKEDLKLIFASDTQAEKTYDAVVKEFMRHVGKKDTAGLLEARQTFDKIPAIKKLLESERLGENTKREVVLAVRNQANKYIANQLPKGNKYREELLRESRMIEAMENIAEKNASTIGMNKLQALTKDYPVMKWALGSIASAAAGAAGVGVGSVIIGSTD